MKVVAAKTVDQQILSLPKVMFLSIFVFRDRMWVAIAHMRQLFIMYTALNAWCLVSR